MRTKVYSFPEIEQFRNVIQAVKYRAQIIGKDENGVAIFDETLPLPTLKFKGTVKLHGTNFGVVLDNIDGFSTQSRENIITPMKDNVGSAAFAYSKKDIITGLITSLAEFNNVDLNNNTIVLYCEWVGKGVQAKVGISKIDKSMVIFSRAKVVPFDETKESYWITTSINGETLKSIENRIYNIDDYKTYEIDIDFNNPKESAEKLADIVTEIETECPVAKALGVEGIGEGVVLECITDGWTSKRFTFKCKGDEHKNVKSKEKVPVDIERVNSIKELVETIVGEPRLEQGLDHLRQLGLDFDRKNLGVFIKWVYNDVIKEELDTIMGNGFEPKDISGEISNKARLWFFKKEEEML